MLEQIQPQLLQSRVVSAVAEQVDDVAKVAFLQGRRLGVTLPAFVQPVPNQIRCVNGNRSAEYLKQSTHPSLHKKKGRQ